VTSAREAREPIEARLTAAGLPPLPRTAWAEIDLDALGQNLSILRQRAGGVAVHPVVKGDAYGHGAIPVARALEAAGADGLCVAVIDEALALRTAGIALPILVLYPSPPELVDLARGNSTGVSAGSRERLDALLRAAAGNSDAPPLEIQLDVETGLGRNGLLAHEVEAAVRAILAAPGARFAGAWTHLQAPENESLSAAQVDAFDRVVKALASVGLPHGRRHLEASGSLVIGDDVALDAVRTGLATYGLVPDELLDRPAARELRLRPVLSLHARAMRVAELPAGTGISYGPTFVTSRTSRIATLPIGYGDGWSRALSNRAEALVRGHRVPLVGNVAMDAVMADVTDVPGEPVTADDEFVLVGSQGSERIAVSDVAAARATNSWEVVTSLAARLPRVYHAASVPRELRTLTSDAAATRRSMRP
jgi:alanine racemase